MDDTKDQSAGDSPDPCIDEAEDQAKDLAEDQAQDRSRGEVPGDSNDQRRQYAEMQLDRLFAEAHGDLIHDNFVPRWSKLATAEPKRIVIIGVFLIFGMPFVYMCIAALAGWWHTGQYWDSGSLGTMGFSALGIFVVISVMRRIFKHHEAKRLLAQGICPALAVPTSTR